MRLKTLPKNYLSHVVKDRCNQSLLLLGDPRIQTHLQVKPGDKRRSKSCRHLSDRQLLEKLSVVVIHYDLHRLGCTPIVKRRGVGWQRPAPRSRPASRVLA